MDNWLVIIFSTDKEQSDDLCALLNIHNYPSIPVGSLTNLEEMLNQSDCRVLLMDFDNVDIDKKLFRNLKKIKPSVHILGLSKRSFHPELVEAMSKHIYACLNKPIDEDELIYLLKNME